MFGNSINGNQKADWGLALEGDHEIPQNYENRRKSAPTPIRHKMFWDFGSDVFKRPKGSVVLIVR